QQGRAPKECAPLLLAETKLRFEPTEFPARSAGNSKALAIRYSRPFFYFGREPGIAAIRRVTASNLTLLVTSSSFFL
ncbi:MAG: hypothetical protein J5958_06020, partial [Clostridia bacterium]|nr:hypothetical protein [Clostridia bacterium]